MKVNLRVLTPVHIGSGEVNNAMNYFIKDGYVYFIDFSTVSELISNRENEFVQWIEERSLELEELESKKKNAKIKEERNRIFAEINRLKQDFSIDGLCRYYKVSHNAIKEKAIYSIPSTTDLKNYPEINAFIKQMNRVYVPGTEIKGAIRTAVVYYLLKNNSKIYDELKRKLISFGKKYEFLINLVKNQKNLGRRLKEIKSENDIPEKFKKYSSWKLSKIKDKVLADSMKKECTEPVVRMILNAGGSNDAKYDIFKFVQVSDSDLKDPRNVLIIGRLEPLNISRSFSSYNECLRPDIFLEIPDLSIREGKNLFEVISKMGFNKAHSEIVNLVFIKKACYEFANDLIEEEIDFFTNTYRDNDIISILNDLLKTNTIENPLIRIGKDQGYLSITTALVVKKKDPDIYENILIHATKNRSYIGKNLLPKNRKIVHTDSKIYPPGWCRLVFDNSILKDSDYKETKGLDLSPLLKKWGQK